MSRRNRNMGTRSIGQVMRDVACMEREEFENTYAVKLYPNGSLMDETTGRRFSSIMEWVNEDSEMDQMQSFSRIKGGHKFDYDY